MCVCDSGLGSTFFLYLAFLANYCLFGPTDMSVVISVIILCLTSWDLFLACTIEKMLRFVNFHLSWQIFFSLLSLTF